MKDYAVQRISQHIDRGYRPYTAALIILGSVAFMGLFVAAVANYLN